MATSGSHPRRHPITHRPVDGRGSSNPPRVDGPKSNLPAERSPHPAEIQARRTRVIRPSVMDRNPVIAEHAKVTNQRFQSPAIARRADHRVRTKANPTIEDHLASRKPLHRADGTRRALLERRDEAVIHRWVATMLSIVGVDADRGSRDAVPSEVAKRQALHGAEDR